MVSLAIILILSTVVGLVYSSSFSHARDSRRVSDIASIKTSLETYQMEHNGEYYHPDTEITRGVIFPQSLDNPIAYQMDFDEKIGEKHSMNIVPVDPLNKRFYVYSVTPDGQQYQIVATFESPNIQTAFTFPIETAYADFPTDCSSQNKNIAYVSGDFVSKNIRTIPSLVYAFDHTKENIDIALYSNKKKAVFSKQNINLPYDAQ